MYKISLLFLFHFITIGIFAQNILTPEQAVDITLANNYGIQVAKNTIQVAENNTDKRVNGFLPTVNATGGINGNLGGGGQKYAVIPDISISNAFSWSSNAAVTANYTLYNKQRELGLEQLKETLNLTNIQLRQTIEQNLLQVYTGYYEIARLAETIALLQQTMTISKERLQRAQYQYDYGQGTGLNILNAEVDIQRDSINILNAKNQLSNAQRNLNVLMGRTTTEGFLVDTTVVYTSNLEINALLEAAKKDNVNVLISQQNLAINEMSLGLLEAEKQPVVTSNASYNYAYSVNAPGSFLLSQNSRGLAAGVNVSWNLFDGGSRKVRTQNTQINISNQKLQQNQLLQELERDLINAWENYQNALFILEVEKSSLAINLQNFERTEEKVRQGQLTSLEFRQAQLNLLNAATNLSSAKYSAKIAELQVLQLAGKL